MGVRVKARASTMLKSELAALRTRCVLSIQPTGVPENWVAICVPSGTTSVTTAGLPWQSAIIEPSGERAPPLHPWSGGAGRVVPPQSETTNVGELAQTVPAGPGGTEAMDPSQMVAS